MAVTFCVIPLEHVLMRVFAPVKAAELAGLVYSETPKEIFHDPASEGKAWFYKPVPLAAVALALTIILNIVFH